MEHSASQNQKEAQDWRQVTMAPSDQTQLSAGKPRTLGRAVCRGQSPVSPNQGRERWEMDLGQQMGQN